MQQDIAKMLNDLQSHPSLRSQFQCELILCLLCLKVVLFFSEEMYQRIDTFLQTKELKRITPQLFS